jgi:hypothetical protein
VTTDDYILAVLAIPYGYLLSWAIVTAYFHVKFDYHKRFLKNMEGRE